MLIAAGALIQFVKFIQITLLIMLPVLVTVVGWVIFIHYRRKKNPRPALSGTDEVTRLISASPECIDHQAEAADYILYDHTALIREYKKKLIYSHARYTALQQDHVRLQYKCNSLLNGGLTTLIHSPNKENMKNLAAQEYAGEETHVATINALENEKQVLQEKMELINQSFLDLEKENLSLSGQVAWLTGQDGEKGHPGNYLQEENSRLQDKIAEQDYLRDVVEEKKAQIIFLQEQLEQRIRNYHHTERQVGEMREQLELANKMANETSTTLAETAAELTIKEDLAQRMQQRLEEKDRLISEKESTITWLEITLQETKQQNELLNAMAADNKDLVNALQDAMAGEQSRLVHLEQKLEGNRQLLRKVYSDLAVCVEADAPVIKLKPEELAIG